MALADCAYCCSSTDLKTIPTKQSRKIWETASYTLTERKEISMYVHMRTKSATALADRPCCCSYIEKTSPTKQSMSHRGRSRELLRSGHGRQGRSRPSSWVPQAGTAALWPIGQHTMSTARCLPLHSLPDMCTGPIRGFRVALLPCQAGSRRLLPAQRRLGIALK